MTKRRLKNHTPRGFNKNLGATISTDRNTSKRSHNQTDVQSKFKAENTADKKGNLESVTAESDMQEFFRNAEYANADFQSERNNIKIVNGSNHTHTHLRPHAEALNEALEEREPLRVPRRPQPYFSGTPEELNKIENESFLHWKHALSTILEGQQQQEDSITLTPYEKNLEVWRQLWRVIERSDLIVQIVDARNPLLFYNPDLDEYIKEVSPLKKSLLLINKSDLLSDDQIVEWRKYMQSQNIDCVFWSSLDDDRDRNSASDSKSANNEVSENLEDLSLEETASPSHAPYRNSPQELIGMFKRYARFPSDSIVVGMVGYPNVGKSSTINRLIGAKKTNTSITPGKTKHFQTLAVDEKLTLCDCPGLVMPSFATSAAEMALYGILPTAHILDLKEPIQLLCNRIPRKRIEKLYSILLPKTNVQMDDNEPPAAHDFLTVIAFMKGYMAQSGIPDCSRAAKLVLTDVVSGRVKLLSAPPNFSQSQFDAFTYGDEESANAKTNASNTNIIRLQQMEKRKLFTNPATKIDEAFFKSTLGEAHILGRKGCAADADKKHGNKNRREKLRRMYKEQNG